MNMEEHQEFSHYNSLELTEHERNEVDRFCDGWYIQESTTLNPVEGEKDIKQIWLSILDRLSTKENMQSAQYVINKVNRAFFDQVTFLRDLQKENEG